MYAHTFFSLFAHNTEPKWRVRNFQTDCETDRDCDRVRFCLCCCCRRRRDIATHNGNFARLALLLLWVVALCCYWLRQRVVREPLKRRLVSLLSFTTTVNSGVLLILQQRENAKERRRARLRANGAATKQVCFVVCVCPLSLALGRFLSLPFVHRCLGMQL